MKFFDEILMNILRSLERTLLPTLIEILDNTYIQLLSFITEFGRN